MTIDEVQRSPGLLHAIKRHVDLKRKPGQFLVLADLLAWRETQPIPPDVLYWRTTSGQEVDFVIEGEGLLTPVEVKAASRARLDDTGGLRAFLDEYPETAPHAILLYTGRTVERLADRIWAVPLSLALGIAARS